MKMKRNFNMLFLAASALLLSSCLKETFPSSIMTEKQLSMSSNALTALSKASAAAMNTYGDDYCDFGYPGLMMWKDAMCAEMPIYATDYDYHSWYASDKYLGNFTTQAEWWSLYYKVSLNANLYITSATAYLENSGDDATVKKCLGNAYGYRAFCYLDLARMYEYHKTGFSELDDEAERRGIYGLTVPIYTENTTEAESTNNPRVPYYKLYRFILTDLNKAEELLAGVVESDINFIDASVLYGIKARFWLEVATRFNTEICPDTAASDLAETIKAESEYPEYDKLGITSAKECYELASKYAQLAMAGHTPVTKSEWYNATTGFNSAVNAWMFGMIIGSEDVSSAWKSYTANLSPETTYGTANSNYFGYRMIDANLYSKIGTSDWRRLTWVAPSDAGKKSAYSKYVTNLDEDGFCELPSLCNLKFHPGQGNGDNYLVGNVVDIPFMRVEEMYLIDAEAKGFTQGLAAGVQALKDFVGTYRYDDDSYNPSISTTAEFIDEILTQRRIEFWGEGIVYNDYRRFRKAIIKAYTGSNHDASYQWNSREGYVAPWTTIYITSVEYQYNHGLDLNGTPGGMNNPDPSGVADSN